MFCALLGQDPRYQVSVYRTIGPLVTLCGNLGSLLYGDVSVM